MNVLAVYNNIVAMSYSKMCNCLVLVFYAATISLFLYQCQIQIPKIGSGNQITPGVSVKPELEAPAIPFCKPGKGSLCLPAFKYFPSKYRTASRYSLSACVIEKSMSTVMAAVMCLLHDPTAFNESNRTLYNDVYPTRFCKGKNEFKSIGPVLRSQATGTIMAVVREPIDRFISGYIDKCIKEAASTPSRCYGCNQNLTCFLNKQYERLRAFENGKHIQKVGFEDVHFGPQNWYCSFYYAMSQYEIVRYGGSGTENERMVNELSAIFKTRKVEEALIEQIRLEITENKTPHSTLESSDRAIVENELRSNPHLMRIVVHMYYYDFVLFGFPLPSGVL